MTERRRTNPEIHLRNVEAGEAAETAPAREGEEEEGERATSASAAAAMARLELEADSMSSGIVFNYDETDNSEMRSKLWHI